MVTHQPYMAINKSDLSINPLYSRKDEKKQIFFNTFSGTEGKLFLFFICFKLFLQYSEYLKCV